MSLIIRLVLEIIIIDHTHSSSFLFITAGCYFILYDVIHKNNYELTTSILVQQVSELLGHPPPLTTILVYSPYINTSYWIVVKSPWDFLDLLTPSRKQRRLLQEVGILEQSLYNRSNTPRLRGQSRGEKHQAECKESQPGRESRSQGCKGRTAGRKGKQRP